MNQTTTFLKKTALALAIASVSLSAYSETFELSKTNPIYYEATSKLSNGLTVTGSTNFIALTDDDAAAVSVEDVDVTGDIVLNATINLSGEEATGLEFGSENKRVKIDGDIINKGTISFKGEVDSSHIGWGISTYAGNDDKQGTARTTINGSIINTGTINITQSGDETDNDSAFGIEVGFTDLEGKGSADGGIDNKGTINVAGDNATAIYSTNKSYAGFIKNTNNITADGKNVRGIYVDGGSDIDLIQNTKNISVVSEGSSLTNLGAIVVENSTVEGKIENTGSISVSGAGVSGIYLDDVLGGDTTLTNGKAPVQIVNSGNITASNGASAINIKSNKSGTYLNWLGGKIDGDIQGVSNVGIDNNVTFGGKNLSTTASGKITVGASNRATMTFSQPHTTLTTSQLNVANGATLAVKISGQTDLDRAIIDVKGKAEFEEGTGINVSSAQGLSIAGKDYILLSTTEGLDDKGLTVTGTQLLKVNSYSTKNGKIVANVSVEGSQAIVDAVARAGGNKNSQAVAQELNTLIAAIPDSAFKDALMAAGTSPAALAAAMEQLSPEVNGAGVQAAATGQNIITGATGSRTGSLRGKSSGEALKETGVWMQTLYSDANQGTRDGIKGYNAYSSGLAIGADGKPTDDVTVGVAYSYLNTTVNGKVNSTTDVKAHAFTLYGGYELGNYFVDGNLTYSTNTNDSKRNVLGTTVKGDYDSNMLGASVTGGYTFNLDNNFVLEPLVAARYANIKIDSFSEKGSPAALKTGSQRYEIAELGVGARVATNYALGQGTLEPQVQVMALHDLAADQTKSTSAFIAGGNPFVASGAKPVRNSYEASVGADYRLGALTFGANYGYTGKSGFNSDTFSAKVRYDF